MEGGTGNDTYYVDDADDEVIESGGEGSDTVLASVSYDLADGIDVETLATTNANGTDDLILFGNSSGSQIIGNNGDNMLKGGGGTDQLVGRGGNDMYEVDSADDTIVENAGQGIDEVWASASYTLTAGADVELLRTTNDFGTDALMLVGNASGNVVRGNNGNNVLDGGDGNDELTGLGGHDWFRFSTALNAATNVDTVTDFNVADDFIMSEQRGVQQPRGRRHPLGRRVRDRRCRAGRERPHHLRRRDRRTVLRRRRNRRHRSGPVRRARHRACAHPLRLRSSCDATFRLNRGGPPARRRAVGVIALAMSSTDRPMRGGTHLIGAGYDT